MRHSDPGVLRICDVLVSASPSRSSMIESEPVASVSTWLQCLQKNSLIRKRSHMPLLQRQLCKPRCNFLSVATQLQPFLKTFQTDVLLGPFLHSELLSMVKSLQVRFVKHSVLSSTRDILKIDLKKTDNLNNYTKVDIGFSAEKSVKELMAAKKISDKQNLEFCMECRTFLAAVVQKVLNKSPLNYSLAKALLAFDPRMMADSSCYEVNRTHLRSILKHMIEASRISETNADAVQQQYTVFLDEVIKQSS